MLEATFQYEFSPCDLEVTLKAYVLPEDDGELKLPFKLKKGDHIQDTLRMFMSTYGISSVLEITFLSIIYEAIDSKVKCEVEEFSERVKNMDSLSSMAEKFRKRILRKENHEHKDSFDYAIKKILFSEFSKPIIDFLLKLITEYAHALEVRSKHWKEQMYIIQAQHEDETLNLFSEVSESQMSQKLIQHGKDVEMIQATWDSELEEMVYNQKREYQDFVIKVYAMYSKWHYELSQGEEYTKNTLILQADNKPDDLEDSVINYSASSIEEIPLLVYKTYFQAQRTTSKSLKAAIGPIKNTNNGLPVADPKKVKELLELGFTDPIASYALEMAKNDIGKAADLLFESPQKVEQYAHDKLLSAQESSPVTNQNNISDERMSRSTSASSNNGKIFSFQQNSKNNFMNFANKANNLFKKIGTIVSEEFPSLVDGNVRSGPPPRVLEEILIIPLGNHIRSNFKVHLTNYDYLNPMFSSPEEVYHARYKCLKAVYSSKLTAKVVFVPINKVKEYYLGKVANRELFDECKKTAELHFPNIHEQLKLLTEKYLDVMDEIEGFQEGEFFITKHTNLFNFQIVIHLILNLDSDINVEDLNQKASLITGLKNLINLTPKYGIQNVLVPIIPPIVPSNNSSNPGRDRSLSISPSSSLAQKLAASASSSNKYPKDSHVRSNSPAPGSKRVEEFFKSFKGILIEHAHNTAQFHAHPLPIVEKEDLPTVTFTLSTDNTSSGSNNLSLSSFSTTSFNFNVVKNSFVSVFKHKSFD